MNGFQKPNGKSPRGGPQKRWIEKVKKGMELRVFLGRTHPRQTVMKEYCKSCKGSWELQRGKKKKKKKKKKKDFN